MEGGKFSRMLVRFVTLFVTSAFTSALALDLVKESFIKYIKTAAMQSQKYYIRHNYYYQTNRNKYKRY